MNSSDLAAGLRYIAGSGIFSAKTIAGPGSISLTKKD
jgi:hypothetical protein